MYLQHPQCEDEWLQQAYSMSGSDPNSPKVHLPLHLERCVHCDQLQHGLREQELRLASVECPSGPCPQRLPFERPLQLSQLSSCEELPAELDVWFQLQQVVWLRWQP